MNDEIEFRKSALLSTYRALHGAIYPAVRAVAVSFKDQKNLTLRYYLDREPTEDDYEVVRVATTEIVADIPEFENVQEECIYSTEPIGKLDFLDSCVYIRKED